MASRPTRDPNGTTPRAGCASRAGMWSAQHRKKAIWGWLAFVVIAFMIGGALGTETQTNAQSGVGESGRADAHRRQRLPEAAPSSRCSSRAAAPPRATPPSAPLSATSSAGSQRALHQAFESPYTPGNAGQISGDGHSALLRFEIAGDETQAADRVERDAEGRRRRAGRQSGFHRRAGRRCEHQQAAERCRSARTSSRAFVTSLPITLVILLIAFGALVAAGVPILLALTAVLATIGLVGSDQPLLAGVDSSINEVILLIGLAVGVDYSMFYLRREREERESRAQRRGVAGGRGGDLGAGGARLRA